MRRQKLARLDNASPSLAEFGTHIGRQRMGTCLPLPRRPWPLRSTGDVGWGRLRRSPARFDGGTNLLHGASRSFLGGTYDGGGNPHLPINRLLPCPFHFSVIASRKTKRADLRIGSLRVQVLAGLTTNNGNGRATNDDDGDGGGDNVGNRGNTLLRSCLLWRSLRRPNWLHRRRCQSSSRQCL
jgi:hypothetical protein